MLSRAATNLWRKLGCMKPGETTLFCSFCTEISTSIWGMGTWSNINLHDRSLSLILWSWITVLMFPIPKCPGPSQFPKVHCAPAFCYYLAFADTQLILKPLQWVMRSSSWLRRRDLRSGYGSRQAKGTFHYWWGHILSISVVEEDGAAQADSALFRPPLRLISRVSISRGWERFGERERVSYFSLEASPYNCYCVLTRRHKRVGMTLTSKVHIKELDHTEMKFLPFFTRTHIVLNPFFLSFFLSVFLSFFLTSSGT